MYTHTYEVTVGPTAAGTATGYTPVVNGRILEIVYAKDGTAPYDNGVDLAITLETTGRSVLAKDNVNASVAYRPRQAVHDVTGTARAYNDDGDEPIVEPIAAGGERVKIVVTNAGNAKTGTFYVIVG